MVREKVALDTSGAFGIPIAFFPKSYLWLLLTLSPILFYIITTHTKNRIVAQLSHYIVQIWQMASMADKLELPALNPPPGHESHLVTHDPKALTWCWFTTVMCTVIPGILLVLRLYTRTYILRKTDMTDCKCSTMYICLCTYYFVI